MSDLVKLSAKLPADDERNGVDATATTLVDAPADFRMAIVWYDVAKVTVNTDDDTHIPTIRLRRIEPVNGTAETQLTKLAEKAFSKRTGRQMLPLDQLDDQAELDLE